MPESNANGLAPVILFVYNRVDHFEQTYRALAACPEAQDSDLFVFSDGPKNEASADKVQAVRNAIHRAESEHAFRSFTIIESPVNRGLAASIISGVTEIIRKYGRIIVVEDDCVASPHFLKYMNDCLRYYEKDSSIGSVAGFVPKLKQLNAYPHDLFLAYRSCSWGWGSWADRWENVDWELTHFDDFCRSRKLRAKLTANGSDRFIRLYRQTKGNGSSWSVRFGAHLVRNGQYTVYPRMSYISNIGCDSTGVHSRAEDAGAMRVDIAQAKPTVKCEPLILDPKLQKAMKRHYSGGLMSDIKRAAATAGILISARLK